MLIVGFIYSFSLEEGEARGTVLKIHALMSFLQATTGIHLESCPALYSISVIINSFIYHIYLFLLFFFLLFSWEGGRVGKGKEG